MGIMAEKDGGTFQIKPLLCENTFHARAAQLPAWPYPSLTCFFLADLRPTTRRLADHSAVATFCSSP
jgi:hypothetical protein